jgi:hypothetical protein
MPDATITQHGPDRPRLHHIHRRIATHADLITIRLTDNRELVGQSWRVVHSDLQLGGASALVRLHVDADRTAIGRFLNYPGLFMAARRSANQLSRLPERTPDQFFGVRETTTDLAPTALVDPAFRFFLHLYLGTGRSDRYRSGDRDCASVVADDGSWAEFTTGEHLVRYDGTHNPWKTVEQAYHRWNDLKRPEPADLGLTVTPTTQHIWHRTPHSTWTHPLTATFRRTEITQ